MAKDTFEHPPESMFALREGMQEPPLGQERDEKIDSQAANPQAVTVEQFAALQAQLNSLGETNRLLTTQLLTGRPSTADQRQSATSPEVSLDVNGLPDPSQDRDGFLRGLAERLGKTVTQVQESAVQRATAAATAAAGQHDSVNRAWARLQQKYPDLADHTDIVQLAAGQFSNEMQAKGLDPQAALAGDMEAFVDSVASRATRTINKIKGLTDDGQPASRLDDNGRADVHGGTGSGTTRGTSKAADKPARFTDELKKIQQEMRLY